MILGVKEQKTMQKYHNAWFVSYCDHPCTRALYKRPVLHVIASVHRHSAPLTAFTASLGQ